MVPHTINCIFQNNDSQSRLDFLLISSQNGNMFVNHKILKSKSGVYDFILPHISFFQCFGARVCTLYVCVCVCVCVRDGHADIVVTRIDAYVGYIRHISDIVRYCRIMRKLMRISASAWPSLVCVRCDVLSSTVTLIVVISHGLPNHEKNK